MEEKESQEDEEGGQEVGLAGALSPKQARALEALLTQPTRKAAAEAAGVSDVTLWRYMSDGAFVFALQQARRAAFRQTLTHLQTAAEEEVSALREVMSSKDAPPAARVSASRAALDFYVRTDQVEELLTHIDNLMQFIRTKQEEGDLDAALRREERRR